MTFPLVCCSSGNTDAVKKILTYVQDPRNHRTTAQAGVFPIASETGDMFRSQNPSRVWRHWIQRISFGPLQTTEILITRATNRIGGDLTYGDQPQVN